MSDELMIEGGGGGDIKKRRKRKRDIVPEFMFDMDAPLRRMDPENSAQIRAFTDFALMGPGRSLPKLQQRYEKQQQDFLEYSASPTVWPSTRAVPLEPPTLSGSTLDSWSQRFKWQQRAGRHDEMQVELDRLEYEAQRAKVRAERRAVLELTLTRLKAALASLNPQDASWSDVVNGISKISDQLRTEFADDGSTERPRHIKLVVVSPRGEDAESFDVRGAIDAEELDE